MTTESERLLLLTGTLDTSGVGGSPYEVLPNVSLAFEAPAAEAEAPAEPEAVSPAVEAPEPPKQNSRRGPTKKTEPKKQTPASAES
ncbi:hypothetical protein ACWD7M_16605 [Streptomyces griseus]